ncbi:MAG: CPBP family intramembrane metalloprotease [Clostridia bacterium]|nr:CPBP family intramembrane metalloprotease [Clostridia bacterium]
MLKVKDNLRIAVVCVVTAFVCLFGYLMLQNLCAELFIRWGLETRKDLDLFQHGFGLAFLIVAIIPPVFEELIFRLLGCKLLKLTKLPDWCVIVLSAAIFAIYHQAWSQLIYQFLMGIWLAWIFMKTHHIGWTMLIHFINNAFIVTYTYFAGSGNDVFTLSAGKIILSVSLAVVTSVAVFFLIKKGIPNYEK